LEIKTKIVSCHTADSKPVKQEVSGTVILPPLVFPGSSLFFSLTFVFDEEGVVDGTVGQDFRRVVHSVRRESETQQRRRRRVF